MKRPSGCVIWILLLSLFVGLWFFVSARKEGPTEININKLYEAIETKNVKYLKVTKDSDICTVNGEFNSGGSFTTKVMDTNGLEKAAKENGVSIEVRTSSNWSFYLFMLMPIILIVIFILPMLGLFRTKHKSAGNGMLDGITSKHFEMERPKIGLKDVGGYQEVKDEIQEIIDYFKKPEEFEQWGLKPIKGVLIVGAPGTGKTLLARAIAGEIDIPFIAVSGSEFVELYVGMGARRVRELFNAAKKHSPCIVFIDEIDAVAPARSFKFDSHREAEQTLTELLAQMDGFDKTKIIVLAATNRPEILDSAILRPGRFDKKLVMSHPDKNARLAILKIHTKDRPLDPSLDIKKLAQITTGFTGADIENLVNEAANFARKRKGLIGNKDFSEAYDRILLGPTKKNATTSEEEKLRIAFHEAGHTLAAHLLPHTEKPRKVSILPRDFSGGAALTMPSDKMLETKSCVEDRICVYLGGRAAEELRFDEPSSGSGADLQSAKDLAEKYVALYCMDENAGLVPYLRQSQFLEGKEIDASGTQRFEIEKRIKELIDKSYKRIKNLISENLAKLEKLTAELMAKESLEEDEIQRILS